jgi:hypothetical protein
MFVRDWHVSLRLFTANRFVKNDLMFDFIVF